MSEQETAWVEVEIFTTSEAALCVEEHPQSIWIPKSQVVDFSIEGHKDTLDALERRDRVKLELPVWLIEKKGLDASVVDP